MREKQKQTRDCEMQRRSRRRVLEVHLHWKDQRGNGRNPLDLFKLASTFGIFDLKDVAEQLALDDINEKNAVKLFNMRHLHNSKKMVDSAFAKIKQIYPEGKISDALKNKPDRVIEIIKTVLNNRRHKQ
jgi:hypothetical protein